MDEKEEDAAPSDEPVTRQATSEAQPAVATIHSSGWRRHWGKLIAVAVALTGFLGWYDTVRNKGALFICDVAEVVGHPMSLTTDCALDIDELSKHLADLKAREHLLTEEQRATLHQLDGKLAQAAYHQLIENSAKRGI